MRASPDADDGGAWVVEEALKLLDGRLEARDPVSPVRRQGTALFTNSNARSLRSRETMLTRQLRQMESAGIVARTVHADVPQVAYALTAWGQALCPALDALLRWAEGR